MFAAGEPGVPVSVHCRYVLRQVNGPAVSRGSIGLWLLSVAVIGVLQQQVWKVFHGVARNHTDRVR